jgi:glycosyltransferase involved in cell wall biosynthesis
MNNFPLVTIIAVCYNQERYVAETLDSIKAQIYPNIQLIVADDGSTDGSKKIIQQWIKENYPDAIFIDHKKNLGLTKNINSAIPFIKGKYYQVFGCDDIMFPDKIKTQVSLLEQHSDIDVAYSDMELMDDAGNPLNQTYFQKHTYKKPFSGEHYDALIERIIISAPSVLIRTSVLQKLKNYNPSLDYEDYDFFLRAAKESRFIFTPVSTVRYRVTGNSLSTTPDQQLKYFTNALIIFLSNYDKRKLYREKFNTKILFIIKNLYALKCRQCGIYSVKAFLRTGNLQLLKYAVAGTRFIF